MTQEGPANTHTAFIGLGSNLGDREAYLRRGLQLLEETPGVDVQAVSEYTETAPIGGPAGQMAFLNAACRLKTSLPPEELLSRLLEIEDTCGRIREERWGPRTLDLDILLYDDLIVSEADLTIPHPLMHERVFVLRPLEEIGPGAVHPVLNLSVRALLKRLRNTQR